MIYQIQEDSKNNRIPIIKNIQNLWADLRKRVRENIAKTSERENRCQKTKPILITLIIILIIPIFKRNQTG